MYVLPKVVGILTFMNKIKIIIFTLQLAALILTFLI